jgi:hypothetical protein
LGEYGSARLIPYSPVLHQFQSSEVNGEGD